MSVTTTADERMKDAKDHLNIAYKKLHESIKPGLWGAEDRDHEAILQLMIDLKKLIDKS